MVDAVNKVVKAVAFDPAVAAVKAYLISDMPWLGVPPARQLMDFFIGKISDRLYEEVIPSVDMQVIKFQNEKDRIAYEQALAHAQATHTPEAHANLVATLHGFCNLSSD